MFGCDRGREEVLYGVLYFQENKFAVSGLPVGPGHAAESQGCCRRPARAAPEAENTHSLGLGFHSVFTDLSYLIFQMSVEVLTELKL